MSQTWECVFKPEKSDVVFGRKTVPERKKWNVEKRKANKLKKADKFDLQHQLYGYWDESN